MQRLIDDDDDDDDGIAYHISPYSKVNVEGSLLGRLRNPDILLSIIHYINEQVSLKESPDAYDRWNRIRMSSIHPSLGKVK